MKRILGILLASFFLLKTTAAAPAAGDTSQPTPIWRDGGPNDADPDLQRLSGAFIRLAERVRAAVVQIRVNGQPSAGTDGDSQRSRGSRGSGFIIHPQGFILTAHHVIEGSKEVEVRLADMQRRRAQIIAADPQVDLAILKINADKEFPVLALADSDHLRVGQLAIALGYPFGRESSMSLGVISRSGKSYKDSAGFELIQTDAGASAGVSGGPLLDVNGHVVGMMTMASERGNIGFAVPVNAIKWLVPRLLRGERIAWGWLGVRVSELPLELADSLGLSEGQGVLVNAVLPGHSAEQGGLLSRDVILAINGIAVNSPRDVTRLVGGIEAGRKVNLSVFRRGETLEVSVPLGTKPQTSEGPEG